MLQGESHTLKGLASLLVYRHAHAHMAIADSIQAPPAQTVPLPCATYESLPPFRLTQWCSSFDVIARSSHIVTLPSLPLLTISNVMAAGLSPNDMSSTRKSVVYSVPARYYTLTFMQARSLLAFST
jgi:hypothetical protein